MFLCVSANPAIDKRVRLARLVPGKGNRACSVQCAAGGKAAHVAMVLQRLGGSPTWLGFAGGASGQELLTGFKELGIATLAVPMKNTTRVNLEIIDEEGQVTELLEPGGTLLPEECQAFESMCDAAFRERPGAIVIFSGSLPPGAPSDFYAALIGRAQAYGCKVFLDTSGEPLRLALAAGPDFVKPNREEAEGLIGQPIPNAKSAADAISELLARGAKSAAISLGPEGLVWQPSQGSPVYYSPAIPVSAGSAVGSGDSTIAGLAFAAEQQMSAEASIKLAAACGAANCLANLPAQLDTRDVQRLREQARVEIL